jgi:4-diphosphocytidyl-2-C-methyl-D-erythritol kinase
MSVPGEPAFAKVNLCLFLGDPRRDGRHELVTLFESVGLIDDLVITPSLGARSDQVICDTVPGPNLVSEALAGLRDAGWSAPAVTVEIHKRIPVAAGMGGGSADAAALLRYAPRLAPVATGTLERIAAGLGADVPGQLRPGVSVGTGAGEVVEPVPDLPEHRLMVVPQPFSLSTPEVFREADRLGLPRSGEAIGSLRSAVQAAVRGSRTGPELLPGRLLVNDLQAAALSLRPEIGEALTLGRRAGADRMILCGSGPTSIGIFWGPGHGERAAAAAEGLRVQFPGTVVADPVSGGVWGPAPND